MIKTINQKLIFIGPHIEPNVYLNSRDVMLGYYRNDREFDKQNQNFDLLKVDNQLKDSTYENKIQYISKIDVLEFKFDKDFIVNDKITFSDQNHWSEFGEIYFGKKLIFKTILKDILFP